MNRKHVVITGGAGGLGLGCAQRFQRLSYDITLLDLNREASQQALVTLAARGESSARLRAETVDLADPASVTALVTRLRERGEPIDVLVNNAGIYPAARRRLSGEGHELTWAIAHLGHFRLTHGLWPLLQQAPAARIVNISSLVQRYARLNLDDLRLEQGYEPIRAYQQAKLSCLLFSVELQRRLQAVGSPIHSYAAHPGVCRTQLGSNRARSDQDNAWQRFAAAALQFWQSRVGQSPETGALPVELAATTDRFPPGSFVGPRWLMESCGPVGVAPLGKAAQDPQLAQQLWARTEALTGIRWSFG